MSTDDWCKVEGQIPGGEGGKLRREGLEKIIYMDVKPIKGLNAVVIRRETVSQGLMSSSNKGKPEDDTTKGLE